MKLKTAIVTCLCAAVLANPSFAQPSAPTLYKRLGGYDALAAITDDFLGRLSTDPAFGRFFAGHSSDSIKRIRQHIVDQLCAVTGGRASTSAAT
jgi:truncated hemoglobin YjbI